jgi:hypothetical protein
VASLHVIDTQGSRRLSQRFDLVKHPITNKSRLKVGEWVEVKSKDEILKTLDKDGQLDGMPFMAEMFAFCGKRFRIHKSAHKACDTVFPGPTPTGHVDLQEGELVRVKSYEDILATCNVDNMNRGMLLI